MKAIPLETLKALGLDRGVIRFFARYLNGAPGQYAELWVAGIESSAGHARLEGRATDDWLAFAAHAAEQRDRPLQFGVLFPDGQGWTTTGFIISASPAPLDVIVYGVELLAPWKKVLDTE